MTKPGRFIVESHCHPQRVAARMSGEDADFDRMYEKMRTAVEADEADEDDDVVVYDNSDRLLFDMDAYDVDMCVLYAGAGFSNEINRQVMENYPGKFVAGATDVETTKRHYRGEEEWTVDAAVEEIDDWLDHDGFRLIGEGVPFDPRAEESMEWTERREQVREVFELAAQRDVPVGWHTPDGTGKDLMPDWDDPTLAGEIKMEYPDVPIIYSHGGAAATTERYAEECCQVAASWDDVYIEMGHYWADLMTKPYHDPNVGYEQMIWGTDWGASKPQYSPTGGDPPTFWDQTPWRGIPAHQVDYWGGALRELDTFARDQHVTQGELNLILGGNVVRLLDIEVPHTRLFEHYLQR